MTHFLNEDDMNFLRSFLFVCVLTLFANAANAEVKIGFVDVQRALFTVKEGVSAKKKLEGIVKKKQEKFDKMQNELKELKDELEQQASLMSEEKKRQKVQDYQKKLLELQDYYLNNQREIAEEEKNLTKPIFDKMDKVIKKIGQEKGFTIIIEKAAVLYNRSGIDLTDEVIKEYNALK